MVSKEYILDRQKRCDETRRMLTEKGIIGPWTQEPDRVEFSESELKCLINRNPSLFNWCGYVGLPPGHPDYQKSYDDISVQVHGGLTFSTMDDGLYWVGFDCAHFMDVYPLMYFYEKTIPAWATGEREEGVYRDMNYAVQETKRLAQQLAVRKKS